MRLLREFGLLACLGLCHAWSTRCDAAVIIDIEQVGSDVVATGSGSIDLADLSFKQTSSTETGVYGPFADAAIGINNVIVDIYSGAAGPTNFGAGALYLASSGTGDTFGAVGAFGYIAVPTGYVSGASLSGTSTWTAATIASLGLTPGTYVYTWGTGADADSLTFQIGPASVPEPSTLALSGIAAVMGLGAWARQRRNV
jgi:hypothetical protein